MEAARLAGKTTYIGLSEVGHFLLFSENDLSTRNNPQCSADTLRRASKVAKIHFIEVECPSPSFLAPPSPNSNFDRQIPPGLWTWRRTASSPQRKNSTSSFSPTHRSAEDS